MATSLKEFKISKSRSPLIIHCAEPATANSKYLLSLASRHSVICSFGLINN
jgi:hypothetical protein